MFITTVWSKVAFEVAPNLPIEDKPPEMPAVYARLGPASLIVHKPLYERSGL